MKSKMCFATLLLGAAAMILTSCKDENKANAVFYQTEADAIHWVTDFTLLMGSVANELGVTITEQEVNSILNTTKLEFYVDNQKLSKTIAINYHAKNEAALSCDVADFPTFEMNLGKDKSHKCTLKVNLKDEDKLMATANMTVTIEADKCNIVRFTYEELEKSMEPNNDYFTELINAINASK